MYIYKKTNCNIFQIELIKGKNKNFFFFFLFNNFMYMPMFGLNVDHVC